MMSGQDHAQEDLRSLDEKYKALFKLSPEALLFFDSRGFLIDANDRISQWLGYSCEEFLNKPLEELPCFSRETKVLLREKFRLRMGGEEVPPYDVEFIAKDGSIIFCRVIATPIIDSSGRILGDFALMSDVTEIKVVGEALRKSEEKYRVIVDNMTDALYALDFDGRILDVNENACSLLGYSRDELLGMNVLDLKKGTTREDSEGRTAEVVEKKSLVFDSFHYSKGGRKIPVSVSAKVISSEGKGLIHAFARDMSDRSRILEELAQSEERYRVFLDSLSEISFLKDSDLNYVFINLAGQRFFKRSKEDVIGRKDSELLEGSEYLSFMDADLAALEKESLVVSEHKIEGRVFESRKFPVPLGGGKVGVGGHIRDITDEVEAEAEIKKTKDFLETLIETSPDPIVSTDIKGRITSFNSAAEKMFGYSADEVLSKPSSMFIDDRDRLHELIKKSVKEGYVKDFEMPYVARGGERIITSLSYAILKDKKGRPVGTVGVSRDISEQKKLSRELLEKVETLEKFNKIMIGRELRMIELKREVNSLLDRLGEEPRYKVVIDKINELKAGKNDSLGVFDD